MTNSEIYKKISILIYTNIDINIPQLLSIVVVVSWKLYFSHFLWIKEVTET
jgi:hypothetical protein